MAQAHQLPDGAVVAVAKSEQRGKERQKRSHEIGADRVVKPVPNTMCETERGRIRELQESNELMEELNLW